MSGPVNITTQQLIWQVQAEEDRQIFEALESLGRVPYCSDPSHRPDSMGCMSVASIPCHQCPHPECVVRGVIES